MSSHTAMKARIAPIKLFFEGQLYPFSHVLRAFDLLRDEMMPAGKFDVLPHALRPARHALAGIACRFLSQGEFAFSATLDVHTQGYSVRREHDDALSRARDTASVRPTTTVPQAKPRC